jgi:hypothetical protein
MGLIKFYLGLVGAQWLFLFSLVVGYYFLLLDQKLKIGFLSFSVCFIEVNRLKIKNAG